MQCVSALKLANTLASTCVGVRSLRSCGARGICTCASQCPVRRRDGRTCVAAPTTRLWDPHYPCPEEPIHHDLHGLVSRAAPLEPKDNSQGACRVLEGSAGSLGGVACAVAVVSL